MRRICLLDLNYTLVKNQQSTRMIRPFTARMEKEEYREDLIEALKDCYVILITARPDYQAQQTLDNIYAKTGWRPDESYFNDQGLNPPACKERALKRFVFPKHGENADYFAVESNPATRAMYARYGIPAEPYADFKKKRTRTEEVDFEKQQIRFEDLF